VTTPWYGLAFAVPAGDIVNADYQAVAAYIEGAISTSGNAHLFGVTSQEAAAIVLPDTTSIGALLKAAGYNRSGVQYSSANLYAVTSLLGRLLTTNAAGTNTALTLMYKQEPGVTAENLNSTQQAALNANNYNYYAAFNNSTSIIVNGMVASGQFMDTIWNVDALAGQIQANVFNALYTTPTKIPQTDPGMNQLGTQISAACQQFVTNGALAPGTWTVGGFGQLKQGDFMPTGFYVYVPPVSTQAAGPRGARAAVPIQVAAKLAGAVHTASAQIFVNP
jgi:hypothetical protein